MLGARLIFRHKLLSENVLPLPEKSLTLTAEEEPLLNQIQ